jgi:hypothetical protein
MIEKIEQEQARREAEDKRIPLHRPPPPPPDEIPERPEHPSTLPRGSYIL